MKCIIGLAGKARSGKDTAAAYLVKKYGFRKYAFARAMKTPVNKLFGWDERHSDGELKDVVDPQWGFSPRKAYQLFSTEFGRALNEDLWVKIADRELGDGLWVVSDVRMENEAQFCRNNGILIHVLRENKDSVEAHMTEHGVEIKDGDFVIENNGTIEEFEAKIGSIAWHGPHKSHFRKETDMYCTCFAKTSWEESLEEVEPHEITDEVMDRLEEIHQATVEETEKKARNEERAEKARLALEGAGFDDNDDMSDDICDLLTNLRHLSHREGIDFDILVRRSEGHFEEEVTEGD